MPRIYVRVGATSCADCLSWGVHRARRCNTCTTWQHSKVRVEAECTGCGRVLATETGYCRMCWQYAWEAARQYYESHGGRRRSAGDVLAEHSHGRLPGHQLALAVGVSVRQPRADPNNRRRTALTMLDTTTTAAARPDTRTVQQRLVDPPRDYLRVADFPPADPDNPWLGWALSIVAHRSEARGWNRDRRDNTVRGLRIVLTGHTTGDTLGHTQIASALRARNITVGRVAEVLTEMGLLVDDRPSTFEIWLQAKMRGLAIGIAADVEAWLRTLRHGSPRTPALGPAAVYHRHSDLRPALDAWSDRFDHLREVTRDDVVAALNTQRGSRRHQMHLALRSLFSHARRRKTIFRNPTAGLRINPRQLPLPQPLPAHELHATFTAAATPAAKLLVVLVAIYGARPAATRALRIEDVDLDNRRLLLAGTPRPIDDLTHQTLLAWLTHRARRWPNTANPHLLVNQMTATGTAPVSDSWPHRALRGATTTLERLRQDRQLEEALTSGADPLHLAVVFDIDPATATRYANAARQLLATRIEDHASPRTPGQDAPTQPDPSQAPRE